MKLQFETADIPCDGYTRRSKYDAVWAAIDANPGKAQRLACSGIKEVRCARAGLMNGSYRRKVKIHTRVLPDGMYVWIEPRE